MCIKSKKIFASVLSCIIFITCFITVLTTVKFVHAETETLEEKIIRYTEDDILEGEEDVTIQDFAEKYKKGEYRPAGYPNGYPVTNIINKVVPKELFYTAGAHAYMGKEYGFIVYTYTNNNGLSYFSHMLLIDFDFIISEDSTNEKNPAVTQPIYRMEILFQTFLETSNDQGRSDWEIYQPQSWVGTDIYLQNIFISANLENENEYNAYDLNYDKVNDGGSIIEYATVDYCGYENGEKNNLIPITEWE